MELTISQCLVYASKELTAVTADPLLDAEILLAFVLEKPRSYLHAWPENVISDAVYQKFLVALKRRKNGEPIAYIVGKKDFWSLDLNVNESTLIPRADTECLVEAVLDLLPASEQLCLAELGTGSGAIALSLAKERPSWHIDAIDISENALTIARKNAQTFALTNISFYQSNWCDALPSSQFDAVVSNPPYIAESEWDEYAEGLQFEPRAALVSGYDGLDAIRAISASAQRVLKPGGYLFFEHGFMQGAAVRLCLLDEGFVDVETRLDLSGKERVTLARFMS